MSSFQRGSESLVESKNAQGAAFSRSRATIAWPRRRADFQRGGPIQAQARGESLFASSRTCGASFWGNGEKTSFDPSTTNTTSGL